MVLGLVGYCARPAVTDWWVARQACGGVLPEGLVGRLLPEDKRLAEADEETVESLGSYECTVSYEGDDEAQRLFTVRAYTHRDQQEQELYRSFPKGGWSDLLTLPTDLPGFVDESERIQFLQPCPALGQDDEGRPRKMLVTVSSPWARSDNVSGYLRVVIAAAGRASDRLGCGAEPLKQPESGVRQAPRPVPAQQAADTACGPVLGKLPKDTYAAQSGTDSGPVRGCSLYVETEQERQQSWYVSDEELEDPDAGLRAWYGDWSNRFVHEDGQRLSNTVTARCDGENANFAAWAGDESGISAAELRDLVLTFAKSQAERRGCTDVRAVPTGTAERS